MLRPGIAPGSCHRARSGKRCVDRWRAAPRRRDTDPVGRQGARVARPLLAGSTPMNVNADPSELAKFSALAHHWWDPTSEFKPLHDINPLRLSYIARQCGELAGKAVLDIGCGGGILTEAMAHDGAKVTGIDLSDKALGVARLHQIESGASVDYRLTLAEALAMVAPRPFDNFASMELL